MTNLPISALMRADVVLDAVGQRSASWSATLIITAHFWL